MRIVYDDQHTTEFVELTDQLLKEMNLKSVASYEWGTDRIQTGLIKSYLNENLTKFNMEIGDHVEHAHGIGNNCRYPVYYTLSKDKELQIMCYININSGLYSEAYLNIEDYNKTIISPKYKIRTYGIEKQ